MAVPTRTETSVTPPRRRLSRADRSQQLLDVAEQVFAERGFQGASMDDVADRAGVTKPVLYDHFGSKDGLLAAVILRAGAELRTALRAAVVEARSPDEALEQGLHIYFSFIESRASSWVMLLTDGAATAAGTSALEELRREQVDYIAGLIAAELPSRNRAAARVAATVYAQAIVGACERLAFCRRDDPSLDPRTVTARLMELLWLGMGEVRAGATWAPKAHLR
jgi:AcrR family transcriptional regulator